MALIDRAEFPQRVELIFGSVSALRHHAVEHRRGMPFRKDEAIAIGPFGIRGIVPHHVEEQCNQDLHRGKRAARMPGLGVRNHLDDLAPHLLRDRLKFRNVAGFYHWLFLLYGSFYFSTSGTYIAKRRSSSCGSASGVVKRML